MQLKIYSIRDAKTEVFNPPFFNQTHGEAERNFKDLVNDTKTKPGLHPEDYDLYYIGDYDDNTGKVDPLSTPQHIVKAVQLIQKPSLAN
ncbi:MAG: nonstructural protein [Arizlama microvirus]|nr:MAG: nonstructural protein [Arizlama microvirus]